MLQQARLCATVAEIVRATGAKPNTVRVVLLRAKAKGLIHIERFRRGQGALAIRATASDAETANGRLNGLIGRWCGGLK